MQAKNFAFAAARKRVTYGGKAVDEMVLPSTDSSIKRIHQETKSTEALGNDELQVFADGGTASFSAIPFTRLSAMGTALMPLTTAVQTAVSGAGGSGLYYVDTGGNTMFQMQIGGIYIGSLQSSTGGVGGGQAQMTQLLCDPTMIFMAAVLAGIDKKLDKLRETQQEMLDFLVQKEKSKTKGNLSFLVDVFSNFKYNLDNPSYKSNIHVKVLDIRQESEEQVDFYKNQINSRMDSAAKTRFSHNLSKQIQALQSEFKEYQLSLYLMAFSSFLEVLLLENYNSEYLNSVSEKIRDYDFEYKELYTKGYEIISSALSGSAETTLLKGLAGASTAVGKAIEKIPVISKAYADEALISAGARLNAAEEEKLKKSLAEFIKHKTSSALLFVDNIEAIDQLYNKPLRIAVDAENLYIAPVFK